MADQPASTIELEETQSLYAYALSATSFDDVVGTVGINEEASVFVAQVGGLGVTLDRVVTADWVGAEAEERMRKLEWVAPRAVRHEEVVTATAEAGQTFPLPFATLFSSLEELEERISSFGDLIADYFDHTEGCHEWAVKGVIDRDVVELHLMGGDDGPASGSDYLRKRKQVQETRKQVEPWLNERVTPFWDELVDFTSDHRILSTKTTRQASDEDVVFNWAFLVPDELRVEFEAKIDAFHATHQEEGLELRLSGPWAPYSFRPALPESS